MIQEFEKNYKLSWAITILIAGLIFYFSTFSFSRNISELGYVSNWKSIVYHIFIFFSLSLFLLISFVRGRKDYRLFLFSFFVLVAYGILDEIHQFFVPGRFCSLIDLGFDSLGILFAFMIYLIYLKLK